MRRISIFINNIMQEHFEKSEEWGSLLEAISTRDLGEVSIKLMQFMKKFPDMSPDKIEVKLRKLDLPLFLFAEDPKRSIYTHGVQKDIKGNKTPFLLSLSTKSTREICLPDFESGCHDPQINLDRLKNAGFNFYEKQQIDYDSLFLELAECQTPSRFVVCDVSGLLEAIKKHKKSFKQYMERSRVILELKSEPPCKIIPLREGGY